ncbi:acyltransferase family protein [Maliponia aquimaris]|uniref:Acyltransferase family protein n=1 Tax=Maliponia aquimaris TaxID=1673631 RepID=A0A238KQ32_9RHOB|nr:acyltransferase [Maliponia aquimaris]SMX44741.1 Acyltransferase family protein [Maliponia aquimaris]
MTTKDAARPAQAGRVLWLDAARGWGIFLVVFGHAWLGTQAAGLIPADRLFAVVEKLIYNFHMPLFFVLAGVTFEASVRRKPLLDSLRDKALRLLWPLLLWTQILAQLSRLASGEGEATLFVWPLPPFDHLWFLWALFLIQLVTLPLAALGRRPHSTVTWLALALAAMAAVAIPGLPLTEITVNAALHLGLFLLGIWLARLGPLPSGTPVALKALTVFTLVQVVSFGLPQSVLALQAVAALLSLSFVLMVQGSGGALLRLAGLVGQLSMPIYLAHTVFTAGTRMVLLKVTPDPALHLVLGTLAGLIGPVLLYLAVRRIASPRLMGF